MFEFGHSLATVEILNPATETWRGGPSLKIARAGFAAAVVQQQVVVAGGEVIINGHEPLASFELLAPGSDTWQLGPDLLYPLHGVGGGVSRALPAPGRLAASGRY